MKRGSEMPNVIESISVALRSLVDEEPKPPLHVGEVMSCWTYLTILEESIVVEQQGLNMTTDTELRDFVEKSMAKASSQAQRLKDFMQREGVSLPPHSEHKPLSDPNAVPLGAKSTDSEIANAVVIKLVTSITTCASAAADSVRNDVGLMFVEFQSEALTFAAMLKSLMRKRGWLKIPPFYYPPGAPHQTEIIH
jgi:hypothetical protein